MCGIIVVLSPKAIIQDFNKLARLIRHRGPDCSGFVSTGPITMIHERLVIVDPNSGKQPFKNETGDLLAINGEIYNHLTLREQYPYEYQTKSDCEVVMAMDLSQTIDQLDGIFAFAKWQGSNQTLEIARDVIGVVPLYYGYHEGALWLASELKVLEAVGVSYNIFPPNMLARARISADVVSMTMNTITNYVPQCLSYPTNQLSLQESQRAIRKSLKQSVHKQLMTDVPFGLLLSGGLDSSLIASITARKYKEPFHTFSIGLSDSPDLKAAREVATFLGTIHHEYQFTIEEGLYALRDVIWYTETYDVTTIRASTPMYLLAKRIRSLGIKMVLSGEGSDELFGGYLYFHKAPSPEEFHQETVRKVRELHLFDCLRANKSTAASGVETRPPFLDVDFVKLVLGLDTRFKMITPQQPIEKWLLRSSFPNYLPDNILWRTKVQFSDGVSTSWIDSLKQHASQIITDDQMVKAHQCFPMHTPKTKEAYYYRSIFEEYFPNGVHTVPYGDSIACSTPKALEWDAQFKLNPDPSGRSVVL